MYCLMKCAYFKTNNTNLSYCFHMDYINFRLNDCCTINHIYTELVKRALQCHKHITSRTHFFLCWFSNKIRPSLRFWSRNNFVGWFDYKGIKIQMRKRRWPRERDGRWKFPDLCGPEIIHCHSICLFTLLTRKTQQIKRLLFNPSSKIHNSNSKAFEDRIEAGLFIHGSNTIFTVIAYTIYTLYILHTATYTVSSTAHFNFNCYQKSQLLYFHWNMVEMIENSCRLLQLRVIVIKQLRYIEYYK